ncbi:ABC transporter permease [Actinocorallia longicatena]|uniref:ABC transporter permease n=1 Tax=Actinocorallia longicatena TaxID=111803 RepID=A0ABP6QD48_9ACTN
MRTVLIRLGSSLLVLWGAITVAFAVLQLTPGSTIDAILGTAPVTPEARAQIVSDLKLDRPVPEQYADFLGRIARGDFGHSYQLHDSVTGAVGRELGSSIQLSLVGVGLAFAVSIVVALLTAHRRRSVRSLSSGLELIGVSIPAFWAAILLLTIFSFKLGWFPAAGADGASSLVLPAVAVAVPLMAIFTQVLREGLELALDEPFVATARARGASDAFVRVRHALRHALLPLVTLVGWLFGMTFGSLVVVETVFSRPGMGQLILHAVEGKDLPVVLGVVVLTSVVFVTVNILQDLAYLIIDPRLRGAR